METNVAEKQLTTDKTVLPESAEQMLRDVLSHRGWDVRDGQLDMVTYCSEAIAGSEDGEFGNDEIVRAPVGTGKSLAAAISIIASRRRGILCTSTKALQNQYMYEELARLSGDLAEIYGYKMTYTVLKGQSNYLCMSSAKAFLSGNGVMDEESIFDDDDDIFAGMNETLGETVTHMVEEVEDRMSRISSDQVSLDSDSGLLSLDRKVAANINASKKCKSKSKPWRPKVEEDETELSDYELSLVTGSSVRQEALPPQQIIADSDCAFRSAYAKAIISDITVMNTSLFMAELRKAQMTAEFPSVPKQIAGAEVVVFDEGHHIVDILSSSLSVELDFAALYKEIERRGKGYGKLVETCTGSFDRNKVPRKLTKVTDKVYVQIGELIDSGINTPDLANIVRGYFTEMTQLITGWYELAMASNPSAKELKQLKFARSSLMEKIVEPVASVFNAMIARYDDEDTGKQEYSYWTEVSDENEEYGTLIKVTSVPINLSFFREQVNQYVHSSIEGSPFEASQNAGLTNFLLTGKSTVILCSGTITDRVGHKIGMTNETTPYDSVRSPFDPKRMRICVPSDLPNSPYDKGHFFKSWDIARESIKAIQGRTLFICTSNKDMESYSNMARRDFPDYTVFVQGQMNRDEMIQRFKETENAIMFGVQSLSEGVDIPGPALSQVILSRIRFPLKDDPIFEAQRKASKRRGENPFMDVDVDSAAIHMAQTLGRGPRAESDVCAALILDRRITTARYGAKIMKLVPGETPFTENFQVYLKYLEWINSRDADEQELPSFAGFKALRAKRKVG